MSLRLVPVSREVGNDCVERWHRHHGAPLQAIFRVGAANEQGVLVAVALAGRPVSRGFDDGQTLEVTRVSSDGTRNACSMLYGACARAAFALGYTRIVTYTEEGESGSSLRAAGYRVIAERPARAGWSTPSRPRADRLHRSVARTLWEIDA